MKKIFSIILIMEKIRIQKYLSERGYCSRREAERLIKAQKIWVNGKRATLGDKVSATDTVEIKDQNQKETITAQKPHTIVIAYHKPVGVECTLKKIPGQLNLADLDFGQRVFPISRLDKNSRGILFLNNEKPQPLFLIFL